MSIASQTWSISSHTVNRLIIHYLRIKCIFFDYIVRLIVDHLQTISDIIFMRTGKSSHQTLGVSLNLFTFKFLFFFLSLSHQTSHFQFLIFQYLFSYLLFFEISFLPLTTYFAWRSRSSHQNRRDQELVRKLHWPFRPVTRIAGRHAVESLRSRTCNLESKKKYI